MGSLVAVGRVTKQFGLAGEVTINLYDTFPEKIDNEEPLLVRIDSLTVPLFLDKFQRKGRSGALVQFADFDTNERVAELIGLELYLPPNNGKERNTNDDFYFEDFVGYTALLGEEIQVGEETQDGRQSNVQGTITAFEDNDHNPLFHIDINGTEALIPAVDEFITEFNPKTKTVTFSLPDGLLNLYL